MPKGPDVIGPWAAASHLSGSSITMDMYALPPYSIGTGVLLSPLYAIVDDPVTRYQLAVLLFGLSSLFAGWCVSLFVRDTFDAGPLQRAAAFSLTAGITAVAFTSTFTWAEPLALTWVCGWLALLAWAMRSSRPWPPLVVAFMASTAPLVHGRVILIPLIWCVASLVLAISRWRATGNALRESARAVAVLLVTAFGLLGAQALRSAVVAAAWSSPNLQNDTQILSRISEPAYWGAALIQGVGVLWYATASTFGLAPIGLAALVGVAFNRPAATQARRLTSVVALAGLLSVWAVGVLFIANGLTDPGPSRHDYLVYGRYAEPATIAFAACGAAYLVALVRRRALISLAGAALVLCATAIFARWRLIGVGEAPVAVNEATISGVASFPLDRPGLDLTRWSAIGLGVMVILAVAVLVASHLGRRSVVAGAIAAVCLIGGVTGSVRAVSEHRAWDNSVLYEGYPDAGERRVVVPVAVDAVDGMAYSFNMPSQQYALSDKGWQFEIVPDPSDKLVDSITSQDEMVVLLHDAGAPTGSWCALSRFADVVVWARTSLVAGEPAGDCST
jgi:hypothetical protein